jgi:hypothetical protein
MKKGAEPAIRHKFDLPNAHRPKITAEGVIFTIDGVAEGCLGIGGAAMFLTLSLWPGLTAPGLNRAVALLFFSPFIMTGSLWGICRLRYRKRFEFRLKTRELHFALSPESLARGLLNSLAH